MGIIKCVCVSTRRKSAAQNIHTCQVKEQGLVGDIHYGMGRKPSVSMLPYEEVRDFFEQQGQEILYGRFGENLVVEGLEWEGLAIGDLLYSSDVVLEVVRIGAGGPASEVYKGEKVCAPMEPHFVFCRVRQEGILAEDSEIRKQEL